MESSVARKMVRDFWEKTAHAGGGKIADVGAEAHCFAPWYLQHAFRISETQAMQQSSDGNYDFGVDAFHLDTETDDKRPMLVLVQAKYSDNLPYIAKGFRDLEGALPEIARSLAGTGTEAPIQNKVLTNLRAALNRLNPDVRARIRLEWEVLHLSEEDEDILYNRLREAMHHLEEVLGARFEDYLCSVKPVGPRELGAVQKVVAPPEVVTLHIDGAYEFAAGENAKMVSGIGRLSDLVKLYNARRDDLFSRNVRYYLSSKKNTEKGPAGKMRGTLKKMCVEETIDPARFAVFHNGVTIFSRRFKVLDGQIQIREPYVLNGCQTIKNAFFFRFDPNLKAKIDEERWNRIPVPLRIIETSDEGLVRSITVNTNRQNAMSAAALRANDPVQLHLEARFKERKIFYQRQEGALDTIVNMEPQLLEDAYENTPRRASVDIEDLARAISACAGDIRAALHPSEIFESDKLYARCFNESTRLRSIVFLTFLQNLHDVIGIILKKDLKLVPKSPGGPKPSRFVYQTICLLTRHLAKQNRGEFVSKWGTRLYLNDQGFRKELCVVLNSHSSGIRSRLAKAFMSLPAKPTANAVNAAFRDCENLLNLKDGIRPFETFARLDEEVS